MTTPITNTNETSVLKALRGLMPLRPLTLDEGLRIAELQANRLLELSGIDEPAVPTEIVTELPRFRVSLDFDLPTSGLAPAPNPLVMLAPSCSVVLAGQFLSA